MKGRLINKQGEWFVQYLDNEGKTYLANFNQETKELPLHPNSVANLEDLEERLEINQLPDNVEVEFEIVGYIKPKFAGREDKTLKDYAKLIQPKSKEQIIEEYLINNTKNFGNVKQSKEETWDDIIKVYCNHVGINYKSMSEGDSEFWIWIKQNYFSPKKK